MKHNVIQKLHSARGMTRLAAILLAAAIVLLALAAVPIVRAYRARADAYLCSLARERVYRELAVDYSAGGGEGTELVEDVCPSGGEVRVTWEDGVPRVVCSLHGE